jgi:hypothetical protein
MYFIYIYIHVLALFQKAKTIVENCGVGGTGDWGFDAFCGAYAYEQVRCSSYTSILGDSSSYGSILGILGDLSSFTSILGILGDSSSYISILGDI